VGVRPSWPCPGRSCGREKDWSGKVKPSSGERGGGGRFLGKERGESEARFMGGFDGGDQRVFTREKGRARGEK